MFNYKVLIVSVYVYLKILWKWIIKTQNKTIKPLVISVKDISKKVKQLIALKKFNVITAIMRLKGKVKRI